MPTKELQRQRTAHFSNAKGYSNLAHSFFAPAIFFKAKNK